MNTRAKRSTRRGFAGAIDGLNRRLVKYIGPPPLGPYDDLPNAGVGTCPVCRHSMGEHTIDHSTTNAILHCPAPPVYPYRDDDQAPINEFGMTTLK